MDTATETLRQIFKNIADAIRIKDGTTEATDKIEPANYASRIRAIQTGTDISDATATADDILSGKTAYISSGKVTGSMPMAGDITDGWLGNTSQPIWSDSDPYRGSGKVEILDLMQSAGYTDGFWHGNLVIDIPQNRLLRSRSVIPTTTSQVVARSEDVVYGDINVAGDPNLIPENIKSGVSIFGVTGSNISGSSTSDATATADDILSGKTAYISSGKVTGSMPMAGDITDGTFISTSDPVWSDSDPYRGSGKMHILGAKQSAGYTDGSGYIEIVANIPQNKLLRGNMIYPTTTDQIVARSEDVVYGDITVAGDSDLVPENIKSGVSIFGVEGTATIGNAEIDTSDATATADDIAKGKTAYGPSGKITGSVVEKTGAVYYSQSSSDASIGTTSQDGGVFFKIPHIFDEDTLFRSGSTITNMIGALALGNATAADVASGKTFTSKEGFKITGTAVISNARTNISDTISMASVNDAGTPIGLKLISKSYSSKTTSMIVTSSDLGGISPSSINRCVVVAQGDQSGFGCIISIIGMPGSNDVPSQIMDMSNSSTIPNVNQNIDTENKTFTVTESSLTIKSPIASHFFIGLYTVIIV